MDDLVNEGMGEPPSNDSAENKKENGHSGKTNARTVQGQTEGSSKNDFKKELTNFFAENNPKKLKFVTKITDKFKGKEDIVMAHLRAHYSKGQTPPRKRRKPSSKQPLSPDTPIAESTDKTKQPRQTSPKKSSKKIWIIILIVVLLACAVAAYLFKDKLFGKPKAQPAPKEQKEVKQEAAVTEADAPKETEVPKEEPASTSSTDTATFDSVKAEETEPQSPPQDSTGE